MAKTDRRNASVADIRFGAGGVADTSAPTVSEVTTLTAIECGLIDGLDTPRSGSGITIHGLCDLESSEIAGRITNDPITGMCFLEFDTGYGSFWDLFDDTQVPNPTQHLVVCPPGFTSGTVTAGDTVDVYTVQVSARSRTLADEESQRFEFELRVIEYKPSVDIVA